MITVLKIIAEHSGLITRPIKKSHIRHSLSAFTDIISVIKS